MARPAAERQRRRDPSGPPKGTLLTASLGTYGVDLVSSPLHMAPGSLENAQNCRTGPLTLEPGIGKRDGMTAVNSVAAAASLVAFIPIALADA